MALIRQIKVGGTTYNIGINPVAPLIMSGDNLVLKIGSGLQTVNGALDLLLSGYSFTQQNGLSLRVASGLTMTSAGVSLLISGANENYSRGLAFERGMLKLKIATGLRFNEDGELEIVK